MTNPNKPGLEISEQFTRPTSTSSSEEKPDHGVDGDHKYKIKLKIKAKADWTCSYEWAIY